MPKTFDVTAQQLAAKFKTPASRFRAMARAGTFPKPLLLGPRTARWCAAEIDDWLAAQAGVAVQEVGGQK